MILSFKKSVKLWIYTLTSSTKGGGIGFAPNGLPSGSASYSQKNGERRVVDSPTTLLYEEWNKLWKG